MRRRSRNPELDPRLYQEFHGVPPARARRVTVPEFPPYLIKIGRLNSLVYTPERPSRRADQAYQHEFGDTGEIMLPEQPILAVSPDGKQLYILSDSSLYEVSERGIVG